MATQHHFQPSDRGAAFHSPALRIYRSRVSTVERSGDPRAQEYTTPTWGRPEVQHHWYPLSMRWASNGQISTLQIKVVLGQGLGKSRCRVEDHHCNPGDRVELIQVGAGGPRRSIEQYWFSGHIGQDAMLIQASPDVESVTLTAYGPELLLSHKVITGMWVPKTSQALSAMKGSLAAASAIRDNVWEARLPVVLNPGGRGNASEDNWQVTSKTTEPLGYSASSQSNKCKVFAAADVTAGQAASAKWTAYTALRSIVEWIDDYDVVSYPRTNWSAIEQLLGSTPIGQVNLTGKNLLQAMNAILMPVGFGFALEPWADKWGGHRLVIFKLHDPVRFTNVNMAPILGGNVSITSPAGQRAMVQRVDYLRDNHAVRNHIIVMGDTKLTERSLEFDYSQPICDLNPCWDTSTYDLDGYDDNDVIGGGNWADDAKRLEWQQRYRLDKPDDADDDEYLKYKHVFRAFAWNEDGGLSDVIKDGDDPLVPTLTDFSPKADPECAIYRPRPPKFRVQYADDSAASTSGGFESPLVELGIVGDDKSWIKLPSAAYRLDKHRCLVHFKARDLAEWYPWRTAQNLADSGDTIHQDYGMLNFATALHNALRVGGDQLRIRLTAAFEMDDSVFHEQARQLDSSWPFDARALVYMPRRFKYRDIDGSVSRSAEAATIDDGGEDGVMDLYGQRVRDALENATAHGSVVLRGLHRAHYPGQGLRKLAGRNIDLSLPGRRQNKAASLAPVIAGIVWHFADGASKTELLLETGQVALPE